MFTFDNRNVVVYSMKKTFNMLIKCLILHDCSMIIVFLDG